MSQTIETFIDEFGEVYREELEERAAIMQFDSNMPKTIAEVNAVLLMKQKYSLITQTEMFEAAEMSTLARVARMIS